MWQKAELVQDDSAVRVLYRIAFSSQDIVCLLEGA